MQFRPTFHPKQLAHLVQIGLGLLLLWLLAGLLWQIIAPSNQARALRLAQEAPSKSSFDPAAVSRLFQAGQSVAAEASTLSLKALISGSNGVAIIEGVEASAIAVKLGGDVGSYGKLIAANRDHIVIDANGSQRKVYLKASGIAAQPAADYEPGSLPKVSTLAPAANATTSTSAITLTRGQLTGVLQGGNLANWSKGLGTSAAGGIAVEQASQQQLAQVLQLRDGDIIKAVNGRPLNKLDDLSLLYAAFSQQSQLSVMITRQDQQHTISYTVNP
ncbi:hypothetical protein HQ393_15350 [Chitinibacter bivalviorum]|uniref:PDZ domain-containing protein n=1 Tax=Chitinibacter bivalviorum TaxID=2739434 RepID=A0A7H9BNA8_9NEIS|nr:hypothetical protein [Chitinibacter bivalviorum]QLG89511.1 hypothetical protein HQ393_15350 [Chitinibacter bivalviorum]